MVQPHSQDSSRWCTPLVPQSGRNQLAERQVPDPDSIHAALGCGWGWVRLQRWPCTRPRLGPSVPFLGAIFLPNFSLPIYEADGQYFACLKGKQPDPRMDIWWTLPHARGIFEPLGSVRLWVFQSRPGTGGARQRGPSGIKALKPDRL